MLKYKVGQKLCLISIIIENQISIELIMKYSLLISLLLLFSCSQEATYFDFINKAEQSILEKKYKKAQKNYIKAFEKFSSGRANDFIIWLYVLKFLKTTNWWFGF